MAAYQDRLYVPPHTKLYIGELKEEGGTFYHGKKQVKFVDILGTVITIVCKPRHTTLLVDDNTATIHCITFHDETQEEEEEEMEEVRTEDNKEEDFSMFVDRVTRKWQRRVKLGDLVNVIGRLCVYNERWQVVASSVVLVDDWNAEWFRVKEIEAQRKALKDLRVQH